MDDEDKGTDRGDFLSGLGVGITIGITIGMFIFFLIPSPAERELKRVRERLERIVDGLD